MAKFLNLDNLTVIWKNIDKLFLRKDDDISGYVNAIPDETVDEMCATYLYQSSDSNSITTTNSTITNLN